MWEGAGQDIFKAEKDSLWFSGYKFFQGTFLMAMRTGQPFLFTFLDLFTMEYPLPILVTRVTACKNVFTRANIQRSQISDSVNLE